MTIFFQDQRRHFFRPLTGKYREAVIECLRLLYQRLYTDLRDYSLTLGRDQVIEIFMEALARNPVILDDEGADGEGEGRFKNQRELAGFILNRLLENSWLEKQVDTATLSSTYAFSRHGRLFTQPFVESDGNVMRTRHRNTRNTRNALQAFADDGEIHDLLDACEYAERIISDFTDVIAELEERKRELVRDVEAQQLVQQASDEFFQFMEQRFQPDLEIRLSADSVEKYRDTITNLIIRIKRKPKDWKQTAEGRLRQQLRGHAKPGVSLLYMLLDSIDERLKNACDTMLPALRRSLSSFTQRADIIIRQLSYISSRQHDDVMALCTQLRGLSSEQQDQCLASAGEVLADLRLGFIDPAQNQLRAPRRQRLVRSQVQASAELDKDARRELFIQQALDQAFAVQGREVRDYVLAALQSSGRINTRHLSVTNAGELLSLSHAIEVGAVDNLSSEFYFEVKALGRRIEGEAYFESRDEFEITLHDIQSTQMPSA